MTAADVPNLPTTDTQSARSRTAAVIVASTSAAAGTAEDLTGPTIRDWLQGRGFSVDAPVVVPDGRPVGVALQREIARGHAAILTTGGTGISPSDATPEETAPFLDTQLPGIMEELRRVGTESTPAAVLSRGLAGVSRSTFVMNLPGSRGGVADGLRVLGPILDHLIEQIATGAGHSESR